MAPSQPFLLPIVVPCHNEEEVIELTHTRLIDVLGTARNFRLEIVYGDDGSADSTYDRLRQLYDRDQRVRVIRLWRNFGHQSAVSAGIAYATGDVMP